MTWKSHIAIATAIALPFGTQYLPFAILGSTAPDWIEWILKFFGIHIEHRGATHYLYIPILIILFGALFGYGFILWFGIGYFTHWFADSLTISGVPISQFDNNRIHFFGGKIRTGETTEYVISFSLLLISALIFTPNYNNLLNSIKKEDTQEAYKFNLYFIDYRELHEKKIIDNKTAKENRFKLF
jgi:inner membrane protein